MSNLYKRIELVSNIGIIIVAILLGVVLIIRYVQPTPAKFETAESEKLKPGTKLPLSGVDWSRGDKTLLMVLSTNCRYCTESAPFYQQLANRKSGRGDVRLMAVLPQSISEAQKYLSDHGIGADEIRQAVPSAAYATATPTLIMVDKTGSVITSWVGKLPPDKEAEVFNRFLGESAGD